MQESKEIKEQKDEKLIDIKGTLKQLVEADEPELSQEEAIAKYEENKKKYSGDSTDTTEEQEHLKRIKKELLASLERVKKLEEQLFKDKEEKIKLNVKDSKNGGFTKGRSIEQKENIVEDIMKEVA